MIAKLVLDKKREGHALGSAEIRAFVEGFVRGELVTPAVTWEKR